MAHVGGLLIVNADDWGLNRTTTDAGVRCAEAGRITSATAMVYMEDSDRAATLAKSAGLPVGLHLNLSDEFTDERTPTDVRARQARLIPYFQPTSRRRLMRCVYDPRIRADAEQCIADQLVRFEELYGTPPTHIDGHQHVHLCPNVLFARTLPKATKMRSGLERFERERSPLGAIRRLRRRLISMRFSSTDYLFDISEVDPRTGGTEPPTKLRLADSASVEVMAHPGFDHELERLCSDEWGEALRHRRLGSFADL